MMDFSKLNFSNSKPSKTLQGLRQVWGKLPGNRLHSVGIDPGVNFGVTIIREEQVQVLWGRLEATTEKGIYALRAMHTIFDLFDVFQEWKGTPAIVEGAAYHAQFGQVGLEEVRVGFYIGLWQAGFTVKIVPPATIRKAIFGSGKIGAWEVWPTINHNGADSIAMALYALEAKNGNKEKDK